MTAFVAAEGNEGNVSRHTIERLDSLVLASEARDGDGRDHPNGRITLTVKIADLSSDGSNVR